MNVSGRTGWNLRWSGVFAGAVVALALAWTGELFGGLFAMLRPGESSGWAWLGGIVNLALLVIGTFAGGFVASKIAGASSRTEGLLNGLVVWGLLGTASWVLFAILGGNVALVVGATAGAVRLALGIGMFALALGLIASLAGGATAATGRRVRFETRRRQPLETGTGATTPRYAEPPDQRVTTEGPAGPSYPGSRPPEGPIPPSVH